MVWAWVLDVAECSNIKTHSIHNLHVDTHSIKIKIKTKIRRASATIDLRRKQKMIMEP